MGDNFTCDCEVIHEEIVNTVRGKMQNKEECYEIKSNS